MSEAEITTATEPGFDTLVALAPSWYRSLRARNRSPRTVQSYRLAVDQLIAFLHDAGMPTRAGAVKREHVEAFISHVLDTRAAATARQRFASLQQFFKWLEEEGEVERNPMERMKPPTVDVPTIPILTDDELAALIKAARTIGPSKFETTRNEAIIRLFIDTGARLGEVAAMKLEDLDLDLGVFIVPRTKGRRARTVPFGKKATAALDRYERQRRRHHSADLPWFWVGRMGRLSDSGISQLVVRVGRAAGLGRVNPHRFRHSFAHRWLAEGGQEGDLMMVAGWKDRQMLSRYGASAASERAVDAHHRLALGDKL